MLTRSMGLEPIKKCKMVMVSMLDKSTEGGNPKLILRMMLVINKKQQIGRISLGVQAADP